MKTRLSAVAAAFAVACYSSSCLAGPDAIKIGVLTDLSGPYAAFSGAGSVAAAKLAAEEFGGTVLGKPIVILSADHQNKPDVGLNIARAWLDVDKVDVINDMPNSAIALGVQKLTLDDKKIAIYSSGIAADLTGAQCSPTGFQWTADGYALAKGAVQALVKAGSKKWFFVTVDHSGGHSLEAAGEAVVAESGGTVVGHIRHPLGTQDFSSFLLQAQASGADVIGFANAGTDFLTGVKQATELGIAPKQKMAAMYANIIDVKALGSKNAQGLTLTEAFYWDLNDKSREFSKRFEAVQKTMPSAFQAGVYSGTLHYLKSVAAAGTDDGPTVAKKMRELPINDAFARGGRIRADGKMIHDMYVAEVKRPEEQKGPWDLYNIKSVIPGKEAFQSMEVGGCPLVANQ